MIVGLGYQARSGKDTVADYLCKTYGFHKTAFAESLKEGVRAIFGLTEEQLYGDQKETLDPFWEDTPRNILQKVGTECMRRGYREDIWVKCVEGKVRTSLYNWVVSDVRFPNEADAIRSWGGHLIQVMRPEDSRPSIATKFHASETSMVGYQKWQYELYNDGTLADLEKNVDRIMALLDVKKDDSQCEPEDDYGPETGGDS